MRFYFAWVDSTETTFDPAHAREDEKIFVHNVDQKEGEFATLSIEVRNPKVGLLAAGRKRWAWFSCTFDGDTDPTPLFFGRLIGLPSNLFAEFVTLEFIAKPGNYNAQKAALAAALRVFPFYDPLFFNDDNRLDDDAVLEGYTVLYHTDRITHVVTTSDIIVGEDGVEDFPQSDAFYDGVQMTIGETPLASITVNASVNWTQRDTGVLEFNPGQVATWTGGNLVSDWPKPGTNLGKGWSVETSSAIDKWNTENASTVSTSWNWENQNSKHATGDYLTVSGSASNLIYAGPSVQTIISDESVIGYLNPFGDPPINRPSKARREWIWTLRWVVDLKLSVRYTAARKRTELVTFTLNGDFQPVLTEVPEDAATTVMSLTGGDVDVELNSVLPIGDVRRSSYFPSSRGLQSVEFLISAARAAMLRRARPVQITFAIPPERAAALSCRMNARLFDDRLPGGVAVGKIVAYGMTGSGDTGEFSGYVTIACAIGYGNSITEVEGTPVYVEVGYVDPGYQYYEGGTILVGDASDIGYTPPVAGVTDDGLTFPLTKEQAVVAYQMHTDSAELDEIPPLPPVPPIDPVSADPNQHGIDLAGAHMDMATQVKLLNDVWLELELKSVISGPFFSEYAVTVTDLVAPKQIDLEAA